MHAAVAAEAGACVQVAGSGVESMRCPLPSQLPLIQNTIFCPPINHYLQKFINLAPVACTCACDPPGQVTPRARNQW